MIENRYKTKRIIDGKLRWVVVDENSGIINRNPSKDEIKDLKKEQRKNRDTSYKYTKKELLDYPIQYNKDYGRPPKAIDFDSNHFYPPVSTYVKYFGSWNNALKLIELDVDTIVKKGVIQSEYQKGRFSEIIVIDHFEKYPTDLAGENRKSPCDGICPNGKTYDVKSSKFYAKGYCQFSIGNKYKEGIEIYYFLAFNEDWTKLLYAWRVPGEMVEKNSFYVGKFWSKYNIKNMKEYDITERLRYILNKYDFFKGKGE